MSKAAIKLTEPQRLALRWLASGEAPGWYDTPHLTTLKALARHSLVQWSKSDLAPRSYWVAPEGSYLDHWYPTTTAEGEALARSLWPEDQ